MARNELEVTPQELLKYVNKTTCKLGGHYAEYSTKTVSYDDVSRYEIKDLGGKKQVSAYGSNITDSYLKKKDGTPVYVTRPNNVFERIGKVKAGEIAILHDVDGVEELVLLSDYLKNMGKEGAYRGMDPDTNLYAEKTDQNISVRFQTCFMPLDGSVEFYAQAFSYGSTDKVPQNLMIVASSQGTSVQYPGGSTTNMYTHVLHDDGFHHAHNFVADATSHKVGGEQIETHAEIEENGKKGKASATRIGLRCLGKRFNVVLTLQIPLKIKQEETCMCMDYQASYSYFPNSSFLKEFDEGDADPVNYKSLCGVPQEMSEESGAVFRGMPPCLESLPVGVSSAARVSIGSEVARLGDLAQKKPVRNEEEHITLTVIIYNAVQGGVPSEDDVKAAIDDMENLFESCSWNGNINGEDDYCDLDAIHLNDGKESKKVGSSFMKTPFPSSSGPVTKKVRLEQVFPA